MGKKTEFKKIDAIPATGREVERRTERPIPEYFMDWAKTEGKRKEYCVAVFIRGAIAAYRKMQEVIQMYVDVAEASLTTIDKVRSEKATLTQQRDEALQEVAGLKIDFHNAVEQIKREATYRKKAKEEAAEYRQALELTNADPLNYAVQQTAEAVLLKYPSPDTQ